jgi:hypothetical protein
MKYKKFSTLAALIAALALSAAGQGVFIYDQQSSTNEAPWGYGVGGGIGGSEPIGQSFIPALTTIDFIRLNFADGDPFDGLGATIAINLRSGSITRPVLATTAQVVMRNTFAGVTNFFFPSTINLTAGTTYYFDLLQSAGGPWDLAVSSYNYPGGIFYSFGIPSPGADMWFREGIYVVPEPAFALPLALGAMALLHRSSNSAARRGHFATQPPNL